MILTICCVVTGIGLSPVAYADRGPMFSGESPPVMLSRACLYFKKNLANEKVFHWESSDSILGDISTLSLKFSVGSQFRDELDQGILSKELKQAFSVNNIPLSDEAIASIEEMGNKWLIIDGDQETYAIKDATTQLDVYARFSTKTTRWLVYGGLKPTRLVFMGEGNGARFYGNVLFEDHNRAVVDVIKGRKRVRYLLDVIGADPPCEECCPGPRCPGETRGCTLSTTNGNLSDQITIVSSDPGFSLAYNSYNADSSRAQLDTGMGYGWTHSYNLFLFHQCGNMFLIDGDGRVIKFQRGQGGSFAPTEGYYDTLGNNFDGTFTLTGIDGTVMHFASIPNTPFTLKGPVYRLTSIVDWNDNTINLDYGANGNLSTITDTFNRSITLGYDGNNKLRTVQDSLGRTTTLIYDTAGTNLEEIVNPGMDPLKNSIQYEYNTQNQIFQKTDEDGRCFTYIYQNGKPTAIKDCNGDILFSLENPENWATDSEALLTNQLREYVPTTTDKKDGRRNVWTYEYDKHGYLTMMTAPDGAETKYTYDDTYDPANGKYSTLNLASETDDNGHTTEYEYDEHGNLVKEIKDPDDLFYVTEYKYDDPGNYDFPIFDRLKRIIYPNDSSTEYEYDTTGNRTREIRDEGELNLLTKWTYYQPFEPGNPSNARGLVKTQEVRNVIPLDPPVIEWQVTEYEYDEYANLSKEIDPEDYEAEYYYDKPGTPGYEQLRNRTRMVDANGHLTTYEYDDLDRLVKETDPLGFETEYHYDGTGNQTHIRRQVDGTYWQVTKYEYDIRGRMTKEIRDPKDEPLNPNPDPLDLVTEHFYDDNDNRKRTIDPREKPAEFDYDEQNRLILITDALANMTETRYDGVGNRMCEIDANGHYTYYEYDSLNRLVNETSKIGTQECKEPDSDDFVTRYFYDNGIGGGSGCPSCAGPTPGSGNIAKIIDPEGKVTCFKYDAVDRRTTTIKKVGDQTCGNADDNDWIESVKYDSVGNVISRTDPNGNINTFTYYFNNWLKAETIKNQPADETTKYTYDAVGNVKTVDEPGGNIISYDYNKRNELILVDDLLTLSQEDYVARYVYDGVGNRLEETDGNKYTTDYKYDLVSRLKEVIDAMDETTFYDYDDAGNLIKITDREQNVTCYHYDDVNRRTRTAQLIGGGTNCDLLGTNDIWTDTEYDAVGKVTRLLTARLNTTPLACASATPPEDCQFTAYEYDEVNRLVLETYADNTTRQFYYDKTGNLAERIDQLGQVTLYEYNDLYYLTLRDYQDPTEPDDSFEYDIGGRMILAGRDGWVVTFDGYDGANRLLQTTQDANGNPMLVQYDYDIPNRTRLITYPGGREVLEKRDLRDRLTVIDDPIKISIFPPLPPTAEYIYDLGNRVAFRTYKNGVVATYSYNPNNWITALDHTIGGRSLAGFEHEYDKEGNKLSEFKTHDTDKSEAYDYDDFYRLIDYKVGTLVGSTVLTPVTQTQYNLDKLGNWDQFTVDEDGAGPGVAVDYNNTPNRMNEYDDPSAIGVGEIPDDDGELDDFKDNKATTIADGENFTHDKNGNRREDGKRTYDYDDENRLTAVTLTFDSMSIRTEYQYDALGRRVFKTVDVLGTPDSTRYAYDDARVIEEQDAAAATAATYVYGNYIDEVLNMQRDVYAPTGFEDYYYHQDAIWSVISVTDAEVNVVERYIYSDYGCPTITNNGGTVRAVSAIANSYMYTGRRWDEESGLYYYRARYYDCEKGRFLQKDPLGYVDGMNLYEYVGGNPVNAFDPYGKKFGNDATAELRSPIVRSMWIEFFEKLLPKDGNCAFKKSRSNIKNDLQKEMQGLDKFYKEWDLDADWSWCCDFELKIDLKPGKEVFSYDLKDGSSVKMVTGQRLKHETSLKGEAAKGPFSLEGSTKFVTEEYREKTITHKLRYRNKYEVYAAVEARCYCEVRYAEPCTWLNWFGVGIVEYDKTKKYLKVGVIETDDDDQGVDF